MEWMFVSLTTICHIFPLCHSFIATLQLELLDCHNSTRQEGQHPLTGQHAANFRLLANQ